MYFLVTSVCNSQLLMRVAPSGSEGRSEMVGSGDLRTSGGDALSWQALLRDIVVTQLRTQIVGAEVFLTSSSRVAIQLERPPGGLYVATEQVTNAIDGLIAASAPVASGMGIAGAHWAEHGASAPGMETSIFERRSANGDKDTSTRATSVSERRTGRGDTDHREGIRTRVNLQCDSLRSARSSRGSRHSILNVSMSSSRASAANVKTLGSVKLEGQPLSSLLTQADLTKLARALFQKMFDAGDAVIEEGTRGNAFFIIKSGSVAISTAEQGQVASLEEGAFFGEMALLNDEPRKATVTAHTKVVCLVLERQAFTQLMGPLRALLDRTAQSREIANIKLRRGVAAALEWKNLDQMVNNPEAVAGQHMVAAASLFGQVATLSFGSESEGGVLVLYSSLAVSTKSLHTPVVAAFAQGAAKMAGMMLMYAQLKKGVLDYYSHTQPEVCVPLQTSNAVPHLGEVKGQGAQAQPQAATSLLSLPPPDSAPFCAGAISWMFAYARKFRGAKGAAPPKLVCSRALWFNHIVCWLGVFLTLLAVSGANQLASELSDETRIILIGSFGALMVLLFSAPASPLVQPRNVFFGNTLSASIAILFFYLSSPTHANIIPKWIAVTLAPATSIAAMQACGISHPPAGAASLIFISGGANITNMGWMYLVTPLLIGNIICVACAMVINNVVKKRQYPVYW